MTFASMTVRQFAFEFRGFFRNRAGMIFTLAFPIMFLLIFGLDSKGNTDNFNGHTVPAIQFFVPGIIAYGVIGASYSTLAIRTVNLRENGVLKRVLGTPLPKGAYVAAQILNSMVIALLITLATLLIGKLVYGVEIYWHTAFASLVTIIVASGAFCSLGLAVASLVPNADSGTGIIQFTMFPILFISDVFYSISTGPHWLGTIANFFPIRHFANALQITFDPRTKGNGFNAHHLGVLAIWGVVAAIYAAKHFRWESSKA